MRTEGREVKGKKKQGKKGKRKNARKPFPNIILKLCGIK